MRIVRLIENTDGLQPCQQKTYFPFQRHTLFYYPVAAMAPNLYYMML